MSLRRHAYEILRANPFPTPWTRMILCALATSVPLLVGVVRGELPLSIYGALTGYLLALNDHLGSLFHRLWVTTLTFICMVLGSSAGYHLQIHEGSYRVALGLLTYWLGVLAGEGAELEKAVLYGTLGFVISHSATRLLPSNISGAMTYIFLSYLSLIYFMPVLLLIIRRSPEPYTYIRDALKKSLTRKREKHVHAISYALTTFLSIVLTQHFQIERGYWVTITVLLVMKPNRIQSFYVTFQRLLGTSLAVMMVDVLIPIIHQSGTLVFLIVGCAFSVPWALKRNYWIASFFVTVMVVLLIELSATHHGDIHTAFVRLRATLMGCLLALVGSAISKGVDLYADFRSSRPSAPI